MKMNNKVYDTLKWIAQYLLPRPLYCKYSAAASFVRPPSIEFFEDLP